MATLVADCPRCGSNRMTFDVAGEVQYGLRYDWQRLFEVTCICRACHRFVVYFVKQKKHEHRDLFKNANFLTGLDGSANDFVEVESYLSVKDLHLLPPPEHLPDPIREVFIEGTKCISVGCPNAAGAMFRTCVDLATQKLLPNTEVDGLTAKVRRDLGLRLPWMFAHACLPKDLEALSKCIREDGNDGAHAGNLTVEDAEDLVDFTQALLERLFTEPELLKIAEERRTARRQPQK